MSKRTTLTIEDDVMSRLTAEARRSGKPFKTVVNEALRRGLDGRPTQRERFRVVPRDLGLRPDFDLDDINGLIERIEGPEHR
ncbi:MAG: DUF2191 domain-containing protein [Actinomycetota bacterium]